MIYISGNIFVRVRSSADLFFDQLTGLWKDLVKKQLDHYGQVKLKKFKGTDYTQFI